MKRLEYTGGIQPFADIRGFVAKLKATYPGITETGINQAVKRALGLRKERTTNRVVQLFGADILTADIERIPAWPYIPTGNQRRLKDHPMDHGERVDEANAKVSQLELVGRLNRGSVHRSALISPAGLRQTYVWCAATGWVQEVQDGDYDLILSEPARRRMWRDPDIHGPIVNVRAYDVPAPTRYQGTVADLEAFIREQTPRPQWTGTDLKGD